MNEYSAQWNLTIDEGRSRANVTRLLQDAGQQFISNAPALFTANDVRIDASGDSKSTKLILLLDRTSLLMTIYSGINVLGPPKEIGAAQCRIAITEERKF